MPAPGLLKAAAIWSLIPTYLLAGGLVGYGLDRWLKTFPLITGAGILLGFMLAVRDLLKLRDTFDKAP